MGKVGVQILLDVHMIEKVTQRNICLTRISFPVSFSISSKSFVASVPCICMMYIEPDMNYQTKCICNNYIQGLDLSFFHSWEGNQKCADE